MLSIFVSESHIYKDKSILWTKNYSKNYSSFLPSYGYFTFQRSWEEITQKAQKKEEVLYPKVTK